MAYRAKSPAANSLAKPLNRSGQPETRPPEIVELLGKVEALLRESQPEDALKLITRSKLKSPWVTNATAVCLLRLNTPDEAVKLLRGLVLASGGVTLRRDVPTVFTANFASALLACDNLDGCLDVLHEIDDEDHPLVGQLREAIHRWKKSLSLWQRLRWHLGDRPDRPVAVDFPLGSLE